MFRVIKYRNVSGKIQATIETDDQTVADFIRIFGSINKFVDLFHYRMRILKEIRVSNGEQVPLDRIEAEIKRAIQYEKEDNLQKIKKLSDSGKSSKEISILMGIPKSTVARYLKKLRPPENPPEEDSRLASIAPLKGA